MRFGYRGGEKNLGTGPGGLHVLVSTPSHVAIISARDRSPRFTCRSRLLNMPIYLTPHSAVPRKRLNYSFAGFKTITDASIRSTRLAHHAWPDYALIRAPHPCVAIEVAEDDTGPMPLCRKDKFQLRLIRLLAVRCGDCAFATRMRINCSENVTAARKSP
jgi:hypothetical protein